jgi:hypothetical protein
VPVIAREIVQATVREIVPAQEQEIVPAQEQEIVVAWVLGTAAVPAVPAPAHVT